LIYLGLAQTPDSSAKVLLKISAKAPISKDYTFQFTSMKALQERESIKAQIGELLARARGTPTVSTPSAMTTPTSTSPSTPQAIASVSSPAPSLQQQAITNNLIASAPTTPINPPGTPLTPSSPSRRQEEFAERRHLLTSSRELQSLHKELVMIGKNLDEEEFWSSPYIKRIRQKLKKDVTSREGKQKGKSSRMVELKPGQQEGSDVKYTLTSQIIHNIFTEFPSASEFFHRSRTGGGKSQLAPYDDIFDRCLQEEDEENSKPPAITRMDKIRFDIDLSSTTEDHIDSGNAPDFTMKPGRASLPFEEEIEKDIIIKDLLDKPPSDKIILDIQDTRRYFESQTGGLDNQNLSEQDTKTLLSGYKRKFEGWQPEMAKEQETIMQSRLADHVCIELTNTIKKKVRHYEKSASG
ncbi:uncharacterized protein BX663DRAFT_440692, partial [Cokeromyces recurvatus]|uniref:uncharacterized protein n=1 Tax=Cokeromyces recurvatus TaxID=90255 RepID=UPI00221EBDFB